MNKTLIVLAVALTALVACPPLASAAVASPVAAHADAPTMCNGLPCDVINLVFCHTLHVFCVA
jgi:hypothetical protein